MEAVRVCGMPWFQHMQFIEGDWITSTVRLLTAAALIWMCVTGRWGGRPDELSPDAAAPAGASPASVTPPAVTPQSS